MLETKGRLSHIIHFYYNFRKLLQSLLVYCHDKLTQGKGVSNSVKFHMDIEEYSLHHENFKNVH